MIGLEVLNHHNDEEFGELEQRFTNVLLARDLIKSLDELKELDRIEINEHNFHSIKNTNIESLNTSLYMYRPFINEGVMTINNEDKMLYVKFKVDKETNLTAGIIALKIDMYVYMNNYYSKLVDFNCTLTEEGNDIKCLFMNVKSQFDYYNDLLKEGIIKMDLKEQMVYNERLSNFKKHKHRQYDCVHKTYNSFYSGVMDSFLHCFMYLNNCLELEQQENYKKRSTRAKKITEKVEPTVVIHQPKNNTIRDRIIFINGIKIKKGKKRSELKTRQGRLYITRRTEVWTVASHIRHYQNGKAIIINSYKKGPKRHEKDPEKTIYKVRT